MMETRTAEIVMLCKGKHEFGEHLTKREAIAQYMSDRCDCPREVYSDDVINDVLRTAALDYIDSIENTKPSGFINEIIRAYDIRRYMKKDSSWYDAIMDAFTTARVKMNGRYINGFTEENTKAVSFDERKDKHGNTKE